MTEPVGPQYGLKPTRDPDDVPTLPVTSRDLISPYRYDQGSEFGGVPGIIQPAPHVPTAAERLHMVHNIDPTDPGTEDGSVVPPELEGDFL
jgi:hypothetical protein